MYFIVDSNCFNYLSAFLYLFFVKTEYNTAINNNIYFNVHKRKGNFI